MDGFSVQIDGSKPAGKPACNCAVVRPVTPGSLACCPPLAQIGDVAGCRVAVVAGEVAGVSLPDKPAHILIASTSSRCAPVTKGALQRGEKRPAKVQLVASLLM